MTKILMFLCCCSSLLLAQKVIPSSPVLLGDSTGGGNFTTTNSCPSPQLPILLASGPGGTSLIVLCSDPNNGNVSLQAPGGITTSSIITGTGTPPVAMNFSNTAPVGDCAAGVFWYADSPTDLKKYTCIAANWILDLSSPPLMVWSAAVSGAITTSNVWSTWTPARSIMIRRLEITYGTAGTCSTNPVWNIKSAGTTIYSTTTVADGVTKNFDSGLINVSVPLNSVLTITQSVTPSCTTSFANANLVVSYEMQ